MTRKPSRRNRPLVRPALLVALGIACWPSAVRAEIKLTPEAVRIGSFFHGADIRVSGQIPRGSHVVVEVLGKRAEQQLLRRGRHWDIWMTVGEVDVENAPSLDFALSSDPAAFEPPGRSAVFGFGKLRRQISFVGDTKGLGRKELTREFIELKESEGLYRQLPGAIRIAGTAGGPATFEGAFRIPSRIDPGTYRVRLSVIRGGRVVHTEETRLGVRMVGLPAFLDSLARKHGALYGLLSVAIAILFGFVVGFVFKKGGGGHARPPAPGGETP